MGNATPHHAASDVLYDEVCPECDGKVCIEEGVYWPEVEAEDERHACSLCGGLLDDE